MNSRSLVKPDPLISELFGGGPPATLAATGEIEIAGRRYITAAKEGPS
jgi:hypothetical protein